MLPSRSLHREIDLFLSNNPRIPSAKPRKNSLKTSKIPSPMTSPKPPPSKKKYPWRTAFNDLTRKSSPPQPHSCTCQAQKNPFEKYKFNLSWRSPSHNPNIAIVRVPQNPPCTSPRSALKTKERQQCLDRRTQSIIRQQ